MAEYGYGSDALGIEATNASEAPVWIERRIAPLPKEIADEITDASNIAALSAIKKFRKSLGTLDASGEESAAKLLMQHLSWGEFIHTNYFRVPRFRKLLLVAITNVPGFAASEELRTDPEFKEMQSLLQQIDLG